MKIAIVKAAFLIIGSINFIVYIKMRRVKGVLLTVILCSGPYLAMNFFLHPENTVSLAIGILYFIELLATILLCEHKKDTFFHYIYYVILFLACISLFFYVAICILNISLPFTMIYTGEAWDLRYQNYFSLFYISPSVGSLPFFGGRLYRMSGMFWEPGMYAIILNLALLYYYLSGDTNKKHLYLLLVNAFFTFSTSGIALTIIIWVYFHINNIKNIIRKIMVLPIFLGISVWAIAYLLMQKMQLSSMYEKRGSLYLRLDDLVNGFKIFLKKPVFGYGFNNLSEYTVSHLSMGRGNSNGILIWLISLGIIGWLLYFIPFLMNSLKYSKKERIDYWFAFFCIFVCFLTEPLFGQPLMWLIVASEYSRFSKRKKVMLLE